MAAKRPHLNDPSRAAARPAHQAAGIAPHRTQPLASAGPRKPKSRTPKSNRGTLPAFTPVPRERERHDGWTPERQQGFIEALADLGSVKAAARTVGMTPEGAYLLRRHPDAAEFRQAWEAALKCGVQRLEDVAMDRALNGVEVPVYAYGNIIGSRRVYNDSLLMFILRNRAPKRFAADSPTQGDAATRGQLNRLKQEWRAEWDAEQAAADEESKRSSDEVMQSINAKLERMRQAHLAAMSPETRELERAFQAGVVRDRENRRRGGFPPDPRLHPASDDTPSDPPRLPPPPDA